MMVLANACDIICTVECIFKSKKIFLRVGRYACFFRFVVHVGFVYW